MPSSRSPYASLASSSAVASMTCAPWPRRRPGLAGPTRCGSGRGPPRLRDEARIQPSADLACAVHEEQAALAPRANLAEREGVPEPRVVAAAESLDGPLTCPASMPPRARRGPAREAVRPVSRRTPDTSARRPGARARHLRASPRTRPGRRPRPRRCPPGPAVTEQDEMKRSRGSGSSGSRPRCSTLRIEARVVAGRLTGHDVRHDHPVRARAAMTSRLSPGRRDGSAKL